jgi:ABC-2 type transport system permease protein
MTFKRKLRVYVLESKYEFLKLVRMPMYVVFTLLFPLMFYIFFGLAMRTSQPEGTMSMSVYLLGTYGTFGIIGVSLFGFGVGVAVERGLGWLQVKRASPMPPLAHLFSRVAVCVAFSIVLIAAMFGLGATFGGVRMPWTQWLTLGFTLVAGCIPFCAMGLAIGNLAKPNSASPLVNIIYLPMAFCSGLWIPIQFLPEVMRNVAHAFPAYHMSQIALNVLHAPSEGAVSTHVLVLAGFTMVFAVIAWFGNRRGQEKLYG